MAKHATRILEFDAGHRVLGHEGKCAHLHGHRYRVEFSVITLDLDALGRVIDFGCIKEIVGGWIDQNWDHNMILHVEDPLFHLASDEDGEGFYLAASICGRQPYVMSGGRNPTAEELAEELAKQTGPLLPQGVQIERVRMWETPNCYADYFPQVHMF